MKIIVIGSVAAGTSVAAKARRNTEEAEIVVYDQGKDISYSVCGIPYKIGGEVDSVDRLTPRDAKWFKKRYDVSIFTEHRVTKVDHEAKKIQVKDLKTGEVKEDAYDVLVFATGAAPLTPPPFDQAEYDNVFHVRNIQDLREIESYSEANKPKKALLIGAGFIGLEMTEQLVHKGWDVTIVQLENQVMPPMDADMAFRVEEVLMANGVHLHLGDTVKKIEGKGTVKKVVTTKGATIETDIVILAAGVRPNTELAKEIGVTIGVTGAVAVNNKMQTNIQDVYAVGDVAEMKGIREVFADKAPPISSTKSLSGHSLGAAGVHEAIYCMLMMEGNFIAGSANIDELDPAVADMPILTKTREDAKIDTVMSNSFGFGGTNATLVLKRWEGK